MKKRLKRLLNNKGLTLTELIVAMFLTSVILSIAVGMLAPVKNLMNTLKGNAHMDAVSATVEEYIRGTVQAATSLKFVVLNDDNTVKAETKDDVKKFFTDHKKVRAIAILNDGLSEIKYRLYDFGQLEGDGYTVLEDRLKNKNQKEYAVFLEPFYEGTSCAVEFYNDGGSRLQVASQCQRDPGTLDADGNHIMKIANQKHMLSFNLLNGGQIGQDSGIYTDIKGDGTKTNLSDAEIKGRCYLILYTVLEL